MEISIIKPGLLTTVQDMGRYKHLAQAIPVSGAMDQLAHRLANKAVGNDDDMATLEFTYANASFTTHTVVLLAYSGDGAFLMYGGEVMPAEKPLLFPKGAILTLIHNPLGMRTYLAMAGGWQVPEVLGSKSTYLPVKFGGFEGRKLAEGDVLRNGDAISAVSAAIIHELNSRALIYPNWRISREILLSANRKTIRVVLANEFNWFDASSIIAFLTKTYQISLKSNRMGCHLSGRPMVRKTKKELLSTAVTPGVIQVTGNGDLVILMADCQTTGGYPRIAHVADVDLPLCAQLKPGDEISFSEISRDEAEELYLQKEHDLLLISKAINIKYTSTI
ncbi:urea amidolyase [Pedobacter sp. KBW01]|uniref:5-oxoprolinase subunit C family protein n=1 Tax=Pedobacter sp. KBW01 TaxID=2153364 RepID=UPI000F5A8A3E|nr:biotin-dependent carboxyltransferase family protein [Pedobacter sp. KBW01]RQO76561.1 urea amidolyase [Pedobacter sp. KBW01]